MSPPSRFRWVFCQLDALRQCLPSSLRRTLAQLPESLDETYERIVMDIKKGNRADAYRMLQCLAVAIRPLSVAELAELLAFDFDTAEGEIPKLNSKWRWEDHEQAVLSTCSSLITIVPTDYSLADDSETDDSWGSYSQTDCSQADDSPLVQFSHFSVKEFLLSDRLSTSTNDISQYHIVPEDANTLIARACLGVLLRDPSDEGTAAITPLVRYAAKHWVAHSKVKNVASRIRYGMESLFDPDRPYFSAWVKLHNVDGHRRRWRGDLRHKAQPGAVPLYHAAVLGFHETVEHLALKYGQYANAIGGSAGTALHSASHAGHVEVVRSLLKCGMDVDSRGVHGLSPLHLASTAGHLNVVHCLLEYGANANIQSDSHTTPLSGAAVWGYLEIVRVLLEHKVDIHTEDRNGLTPLHKVFSYYPKSKHPQVVRLLLEHGANPNARDSKRRTPLHLASSRSEFSSSLSTPVRLEIVRILLEHGADVDAEDEEGRIPLQVALARGQEEVVQLLTEYCSK
jgi:ankyrin repeat protein